MVMIQYVSHIQQKFFLQTFTVYTQPYISMDSMERNCIKYEIEKFVTEKKTQMR